MPNKQETCPYVVTGDEGTSYCKLAASTAKEQVLRALLDKAVGALEQHHRWHLDRGEEECGGVMLDMAAEYSDSSMYERTEQTLTEIKQAMEKMDG